MQYALLASMENLSCDQRDTVFKEYGKPKS